jgi:hypothetical protein
LEGVDVLVRTDRFENRAAVDLRRQWELNENAVDRVIAIQLGDEVE